MNKVFLLVLLIVAIVLVSGCAQTQTETDIKAKVDTKITTRCAISKLPPPCSTGDVEINITPSPSPTTTPVDVVKTPTFSPSPTFVDIVRTLAPSPIKTSEVSTTECTPEEEALMNCKYGCFLVQPGTPKVYHLAAAEFDKPIPTCKEVCKEVRAISGVEGQGLDLTPDDKDVGKDVNAGVYLSGDGNYWFFANSYIKDAYNTPAQDSGRIDNDDNSYTKKYFCKEYSNRTGEPGMYTTLAGTLPCKKYTDSEGRQVPELPYSGLCCKPIDEKGKLSCYDPFEGEDLAKHNPGDHTGNSLIYQHTKLTSGYFG